MSDEQDRRNIIDAETGELVGWFDAAKAINFNEDCWWNGSNQISKATGSQWIHQILYYTRTGKWVIEQWSQYQGGQTTYELVTQADAAKWLIKQGEIETERYARLPAEIQTAIRGHLEEVEL